MHNYLYGLKQQHCHVYSYTYIDTITPTRTNVHKAWFSLNRLQPPGSLKGTPGSLRFSLRHHVSISQVSTGKCLWVSLGVNLGLPEANVSSIQVLCRIQHISVGNMGYL